MRSDISSFQLAHRNITNGGKPDRPTRLRETKDDNYLISIGRVQSLFLQIKILYG